MKTQMKSRASGEACGMSEALGSGILTINIAAVRHNYRALQTHAGGALVAGVVKADAYGLGADIIAPALYDAGCRLFFVAQLAEALALREILPQKNGVEIAILNDILPEEVPLAAALCCASAAGSASASRIMPVISSLESLRLWAREADRLSCRLPAMIQFDSGMARLGLNEAELTVLAAEPDLLKPIAVKAFISHLTCADNAASPMSAVQRARFLRDAAVFEKIAGYRVPLSLSASCGAALGCDFCLDIIRPGLALYGMIDRTDDNFRDRTGRASSAELAVALRSVISLQARVLRVSILHKGETIGYGASYRAERDMPVAAISTGYADGWPRGAGNEGAVYYRGIRLPVIGRVSMDCLTADLSGLVRADVPLPPHGALIELIGPHQFLAAAARDAGVIPYEILTGLGARYRRQIIDK